MPAILSVDLAYRQYRDIGVAVVTEGEARVLDLPLEGAPEVERLADWLLHCASEEQVVGLCIDGPLGWKGPAPLAEHSRLSERLVRAPGKTGLPPDGVKPRGYLGFTRFSIALFERLTRDGDWQLPGAEAEGPTRAPSRSAFVTETFPTAIWRGLGLTPLVAKSKAGAGDVAAAVARFTGRTGLRLSGTPSHDQLQAVVGGYAGLRWAQGDPHAVLAGAPPIRLDGSWREGYIMTMQPSVPSHSTGQ